MKLQQLVEALDAQILKGDIVGAFDTYAADNIVTWSNPQDKTQSKSQKLEILRWFFDNIASVNRIDRPAVVVGDDVTESQFVFNFTNRQGETLVYNEVIRRAWNNGKVVEEQYVLNQAVQTPKKSAAKKPSKKEAAHDVQPAAAKPAVVAEPKVAKKAAPKAAKPAAEPKAAAKKTAAKSDKPKTSRK